MKDFLIRFLSYNDDANCRVIEAIQAAGSHSERVGQIFSHVLNAHRVWNTRIGGVSPSGGVWEVHPVEQWSRLNADNFGRSVEILESTPTAQVIDYKDIAGNPHRSTVDEIVTHIVNHSTYHRGQLAILLGQEDKKPPATDFIVYARDARK
jgi:uncharacterized damage-inducible protein DinB